MSSEIEPVVYVLFIGLLFISPGMGAVQPLMEATGKRWRARYRLMFAFGLIGWFIWGPSLTWLTGIGGWTACLFPPVGFAVGVGFGYCAGLLFAPPVEVESNESVEVLNDDQD